MWINLTLMSRSPTLLFVFLFKYICSLYPSHAAFFLPFFFQQEHVAVLQALKDFFSRLIKKGLPGLY